MAVHYKPNGDVDRKAEVDEIYTTRSTQVLKSSMVGATWYGAVLDTSSGEPRVWAGVCLTHTDKRDAYGMNFSYKDMTEDSGPVCTKCPKCILRLLTPTDNAYAREWRRRCWEAAEQARTQRSPMSDASFTRAVWKAAFDLDGIARKGDDVSLVKCRARVGGHVCRVWKIVGTNSCVRQKYVRACDLTPIYD